MPDRKTALEIDDVAIDWAARAERGLTAEERSDLDGWLEQDSRHLGAFLRAQAAWIYAERASSLGKMPQGGDPAIGLGIDQIDTVTARSRSLLLMSRRMMLGGGGAIAASVAGALILRGERYRTLESGVGEIRRITLEDGPTLILDTDTRVEVARSSDDHRLELVRGKLFLDISRAVGGPVVVTVGDLVLTTIGGAFGLDSLPGAPVDVLVTRGTLLASRAAGYFTEPIKRTIRVGQRLLLVKGEDLATAQVGPLATSERERLLAWRDGMLSFGGEALVDAVRAFARYGAPRIIVADPMLARQRVTGLFKADDPRGFAEAIAASFGAVVSSQGDVIRITSEKVATG